MATGAAEQALERRDALVGDAARDDEIEMAEVGVHVEREAVARDPARDPDADRRELLVADPGAGQARDAPGRRRRTRAAVTDQHFLEIANVPVNVAAIRLADR